MFRAQHAMHKNQATRRSIVKERLPRSILTLACVIGLIVVLAVPAQAKPDFDEWNADLEQIRSDLTDGKFRRASKRCSVLLREFNIWLRDGPAVHRLVGQAIAFRAVAAMGQDDADLATWYFSIARAVYLELRPDHLPITGTAGKNLQRHLETQEASQQAKPRSWTDGRLQGCETSRPAEFDILVEQDIPRALFEPPEPDKMKVRFRFTIDEEGTLREVKLLDSAAFPTLVVSLAEAASRTAFVPATCNGQPISSFFDLGLDIDFEERGQHGGRQPVYQVLTPEIGT